MIQDIYPKIFDITHALKQPDANSLLLCFDGDTVLCATEGEARFPRCHELDSAADEAIYLFEIDGTDFFLASGGPVKPPVGYSFEPTSAFRSMLPRHLAFAGVTAAHLARWYANNRFCGHCGGPMQVGEAERVLLCPACDNAVYPRISPAVIVGVYQGDELLMARYAGRPVRNYALIAGYVEVGETLEDTVRREVGEEVGVRVKNLSYYKSQPWGFSDSLLMGFFAELDGSREIVLEDAELAEAVWVRRDDIETEFDNFSLTNEMIVHFKQHPEAFG